jgi:hypothetical protein
MNQSASPLLSRLDAALAAARHPVDAACLRAERAGFLARQGLFDEAQAELAVLRAEFATRPAAPVTVWACIVEAWIEHYSGRVTAGRDKMKRAQALSAAARLRPLQALSAAWLAHIAYSQDDMIDMVKFLALALELAEPAHHAARARACLVAASSYHFAGRLDRAQPWYVRAREHAQAEGDDATLGVITFTMAGHRSNHALRAAIFGAVDTVDAKRAAAWLEASFNFDQWVGNGTQDAFVQMFRALVHSAQGHHAKALELYVAHLGEADRQGLSHMRAAHLADQAWCRLKTGDADGARADAQAAASLVNPGMYVEDLAVACGRLEQVFGELGDTSLALDHRQQARDHWSEHLAMQRGVIEALDGALIPAAAGPA